jgi:biopolymer transport protein TolR
MSRHTPLTSLKQLSEINLTPLMDLTFILLITFIITFPLIEQGVPVNLPQGAANSLQPEDSRSITIDETGGLFLDDHSITHEALQERLLKLSQTDPTVTILVRADESIAYGEVVRVLKALHDAKLTRMALVTQGEGQ